MYLTVGKLRRSHGLAGELLMDILTDFPERLIKGKTVYIGPDYWPYQVENTRSHERSSILISFDGITDADQASSLRNQYVYVDSDAIPELPEGEFYHHQLMGMAVLNDKGETLGVLKEILETGANDVYLVITPEGKELLLPAIEEVILNVDLADNKIYVRPQEWL